jgi:hypothetical protein
MSGNTNFPGTSQGFPDAHGPMLPKPAPIRILILTDDDGSFAADDKFGLTELVAAIEGTGGVFARFKVTKAHRLKATASFTEPANADIQEFRFNNPAHFNPADYDEVWLIGIQEAAAGPGLSNAELRVLSEFMDGGGGVLATGDHQDLGGSLCGQVPRVRSMRRWTYNYDLGYEEFDPDSGHGPPVYGSYRHDTLVAGHDTAYTFDDQSDDVPARIYPRFYGVGNKYFAWRYPHPLLCGPHGVIDVLPDHMHEGECVVPADLSQTFTFDGYTVTEYPSGSQGQVVPDVIARGEVFAHTTDNTGVQGIVDVESRAKKFGCIGAYDGHVVNVGRVVVDSTFHHFVNINVIASGANSSDPVKQVGFPASTEGQAHYEQIRAYWRNLAVWLARPQSQFKMFSRTLWAARWDSQLRMVAPGLGRRKMSWNDLLMYGGSVRATLGRFATPCLVTDWFFAWDNPLAKYKWWVLLTLPDPPPWELGQVFINPEEYVTVAYASMMAELVRVTPGRDTRFRDQLDERLPGVVRRGLAQAARAAVPHYTVRLTHTQRLMADIRAAARKGGK